jgi:Mrp family chromosome partitioning ATPase
VNPKGLQTEMENKKIRFLSNKKRQKNQEEYDRLNKENLITNRSDFLTLESYRAARTNIMFSLPDEKGCKKIVITSAMPGDGKTTTSINLALIFAQTGARVLLIDADLRLPMIHHYLDIPNNNGLSNVLAGLADVNDVIVKSRVLI